jgi:hypothetical protein
LIIWNNWERFNGEQDNPGDSTDYNIPLIAVKPEVNSVADYFGLPLGKTMNVIIGIDSTAKLPVSEINDAVPFCGHGKQPVK